MNSFPSIDWSDPDAEVYKTKGSLVVGDGTKGAELPVSPNTGYVLTVDPTTATGLKWSYNAAGGDVAGPATATNNALVRFSGSTGKLVKNSSAILDDNATLTLTNPLWNGDAIQTFGAGEATPMFKLTTDGRLMFGNGSGDPLDAMIRYQGAGSLLLGDVTSTPNGVLTLGMIDARTGVTVQGYILRNGKDVVTNDVDASVTDNALVRWDGTTMKAVQNSTATLSDTGTLTTNDIVCTSTNQALKIGASGAPSPSITDVPNATFGNKYYTLGAYDKTGLKLRLYDTTTDFMGIGNSTDQFNYVASSDATSHVFYTNGAERARINSNGVTVPNLITSAPSGESIRLGTTTTAANATTTPLYMTLGDTYYNGTNPYDKAGMKLRILENPTTFAGIGMTNGQVNYAASASNAHVFYSGTAELAKINSSGISTNALTAASLYLGQLTGMKLTLYSPGYGFGIGSATLNYYVPTGGSHDLLINSVSTVNVSSTALRTTVPITTGSGDLSLNPAGSNVAFNNKSINGVNSVYFSNLMQQTARGNVQFANGDSNSVYIHNNNPAGSTISTMRLQARHTGTLASGICFNTGYNASTYVRDNVAARGFLMEEDISANALNIASWDGATRREHMQVKPADGEYVQFPNGILASNIRAATAGGGTIDFNGATLSNCIVPSTTIETSGSASAGDTNWTGTLLFEWWKIGNMVTVRISGTVTSTVDANAFDAAAIIPAGFRPPAGKTYWNLHLRDDSEFLHISIDSTGKVSVYKRAVGFSNGELLQWASTAPTCHFMAA